jgi:hypothetical protein
MTHLVMTSLVLGAALPIYGQRPIPTEAPAADTTVERSPSLDSSTVPRGPVADSTRLIAVAPRDLRVAAHYAATRQSESSAMVARQRAGLGQPMAMMVVGGAALLVGAIIGDTPGTIFMIGGAVIGLVGLYEYLQ